MGSNFVVAFLASKGLLTCIGVRKNATNHPKGSIRVQNECQFRPQMPVFHSYLQYCMKFQILRFPRYLDEFFCPTMIFWEQIDYLRRARMPRSLKNHVQKFIFMSENGLFGPLIGLYHKIAFSSLHSRNQRGLWCMQRRWSTH